MKTIVEDTPTGSTKMLFDSLAAELIMAPFINKFNNFPLYTPARTYFDINRCSTFMHLLYGHRGGATIRYTMAIDPTKVEFGYIEAMFTVNGYLHTFVYSIRHGGFVNGSPSTLRIKDKLYTAMFKYYKVTKNGERANIPGYPVSISIQGDLFVTIIFRYQNDNPALPEALFVEENMFALKLTNQMEWTTGGQYRKDNRNIEKALYESGYFDAALDQDMREFIWEMA